MSSVITSLQLILPPRPTRTKSLCSLKNPTHGQEHELSSSSSSNSFLPNLISFALALSLTSSSPALAIPSLSSSQPQTTPFTQSKFVQTGLLNGKIRPCPSTNPSCVSTNPTSSSFSFPLMIPETDTQDPNLIIVRLRVIIKGKSGQFWVKIGLGFNFGLGLRIITRPG